MNPLPASAGEVIRTNVPGQGQFGDVRTFSPANVKEHPQALLPVYHVRLSMTRARKTFSTAVATEPLSRSVHHHAWFCFGPARSKYLAETGRYPGVSSLCCRPTRHTCERALRRESGVSLCPSVSASGTDVLIWDHEPALSGQRWALLQSHHPRSRRFAALTACR